MLRILPLTRVCTDCIRHGGARRFGDVITSNYPTPEDVSPGVDDTHERSRDESTD